MQLPVAAGTNPDWSPLGHELAYSTRGGDSPGGASLAVISRGADGGWSGARNLVTVTGMQTALFPSYAPDGLHLAYVRGRGGHGDPTFQLWLIGADGGSNTELLAANRKVNNCLGISCDAGMTNGQYENTMPTWAPPGDLDRVAFNWTTRNRTRSRGPCSWVALSRRDDELTPLQAFASKWKRVPPARGKPWTDQATDLVGALRWSPPTQH